MDRLAASRAKKNVQTTDVEMGDLTSGSNGAGKPNSGSNHHPMNTEGEVYPTHDAQTMNGFLSEITSLQSRITHLNALIDSIQATLASSVPSPPTSSSQYESKTTSLTTEAAEVIAEIKQRVQRLGEVRIPGMGRADVQVRKDHIKSVRSKFIETLRRYQTVEQEGRVKERSRVERQLKIMKPDATPQEIDQALETGGTQIFADAVVSSRSTDSRTALGEVQLRHEEMKRMEQTLGELGQMFIDMAYIVDQQDEMFKNLEETTQEVEDNTQHGLKDTEAAVVHARRARRMRWICFGICAFIVLVLALVLGIYFGTK